MGLACFLSFGGSGLSILLDVAVDFACCAACFGEDFEAATLPFLFLVEDLPLPAYPPAVLLGGSSIVIVAFLSGAGAASV